MFFLTIFVFFCNRSVLEQALKRDFAMREKEKKAQIESSLRDEIERSNNYLGWNSTRSKMIFWWWSFLWFAYLPLALESSDGDSHDVSGICAKCLAASEKRFNDSGPDLMLNFLVPRHLVERDYLRRPFKSLRRVLHRLMKILANRLSFAQSLRLIGADDNIFLSARLMASHKAGRLLMRGIRVAQLRSCQEIVN